MNRSFVLPDNKLALTALAGLLLAGCASNEVPPDALRLEESTLDIRSIQTRTFTGTSANQFLEATISALQDMEFNIDRIEKQLGVITASKVSDADSGSEQAGLIMLDVLCVISMSGGCDARLKARDEQHITVTMVVLPSLARDDEFVARVTIQRVIYDKAQRIVELQQIIDAEIYQQVFANLSKATYIQVTDND